MVTSGTCTRTLRRRGARPASSATSRPERSAAARCRIRSRPKRRRRHCAMPDRTPTPRTFRAPGRVNLIGGQVDYHEGFVVAMAIDREVRVTATARNDAMVSARSGEFDGDVVVRADGFDEPT